MMHHSKKIIQVIDLLTSCATARIKGKNSLNSNIHSRGIKGLKHNLSHFFTIGLGVERSLCEEDWVLFWGHTKLIVEGVVPNFLHVVPTGHDSVFERVFKREDAPLGLGFVAVHIVLERMEMLRYCFC